MLIRITNSIPKSLMIEESDEEDASEDEENEAERGEKEKMDSFTYSGRMRGIFGRVIHYTIRLEYQGRGKAHLHVLLSYIHIFAATNFE